MTLTQLEYVVAVAKHLNFSLAANECGIAQPSLSAQIQKLENELGLFIFERGKARVRITDAGREVVEKARAVLLEASQLKEVARFQKLDPRGTLRLGIIPTIAPFLLPHFMEDFAKEYPKVQIELQEDKTESLVRMLNDGMIDVAILSTPKKITGNFYEKFLYNEPFVVYAAQGHELLEKKTIGLKSLESMHPILLDETHCMRDQVEAICSRSHGDEMLKIRRGTLQTLLSVVEIKKGFTLVPLLMAQSLSVKQSKQIRPIVSPAPCRKVSLLYHGTLVARPMLEALHRVIKRGLPNSLSGSKRLERVISPSSSHF